MAQTNDTRERGAQRAALAVRAVLPRAARARAARRDSEADLIVGQQPLRIQWVGEGNLGDVRDILARRRSRPDVVVARRLSVGAREALSLAGIGWVDEMGAAEIAVGAIIVSRTGRTPEPAKRAAGWTPAVLAIAEALLCGTKATVSATEMATGLSSGSCTNALRVLASLGLLEAKAKRGRGSARLLGDSGRLLDAYASAAEALPAKVGVQVGVTWRDPVAGLVDVGNKWNKLGVEWASTGAAAALAIAPYLTTVVSTEVYVGSDTIVGLEAIAADAGLRPIEGGRLMLRPFPTIAVRRLAEEIDGLRVAPWPRVYADLRTHGVRGEEAALHLREVICGG
jgi:hypothetical protein